MPNKNYVKGRRKEYKIVKQERDNGRLAFRSAGSHSPVDVVSIDIKAGVIRLIQCKPDDMPASQKEKLIVENKDLNGVYNVRFIVL